MLTELEANSDYTVRVANVCTENLVSQWTSADFTTTGVGINGVEFDGSLSLYPNPASTTVTLSVSEQMAGSTVSIVDVNGRVVYTQALKQSDNQTITIDLSDLAKGDRGPQADCRVKQFAGYGLLTCGAAAQQRGGPFIIFFA